MGLNLVLVTQRQTQGGLALTWNPMEDVSSYQVFVANRRLNPEELEAAQALGGTDDCLVAKVGGGAKSVVDDVTPAGEARFYAVAMLFKDGTVRAARFRAVPDGKTDDSGETVRLSDFKTLLAYAQQHHLARFTFWAVNRDRGCGGSNTDGDTCSGISQSAYDFTKVIAQYRR